MCGALKAQALAKTEQPLIDRTEAKVNIFYATEMF